MKRWLFFILGIFISIFFSFIFFSDLDHKSIFNIVNTKKLSILIYPTFFYFTGHIFRGLRWQYMLSKIKHNINVISCLQVYFAGMGLNNFLPFRIGDVFRITSFNKKLSSINKEILAGSLLLEKIIDISIIFIIFFIGLYNMPKDLIKEKIFYINLNSIIIFIILFSIFICILFLIIMMLNNKFIFLKKVEIWINKFIFYIRWFLGKLNNRNFIINIFLLSLTSWIFEAVAIYFIIKDNDDGINNFLASLFSMALGTLSTLIPSSPGYVGTFHYSIAKSFQIFGISKVDSYSYALLVHSIFWISISAIGIVSFCSLFIYRNKKFNFKK